MSAWKCLEIVAKFYDLSCNSSMLKKRFYIDSNTQFKVQIPRAAKSVGLKCKAIRCHRLSLSKQTFPILVEFDTGEFCIVAQYRSGQFLIQRPFESSPEIIEEDEFIASLSGYVYLFTKRRTLEDLSNQFNFKWFISSFVKHKKLLLEVIVASLFIQILALVSPIFFQVVVDKVLTHHSFSTLNVLAIGMVLIISFDVVITGLRNYQLAHTAHRIDVTLGSRLYKHLVSLPLAYFQSRQVGVTVARVHELQNIREFLTGSALTLCLDVLFTFVFISVMASYSTTLTLIVLISLIPYVFLSALVTPILRKRLDEQFRQGAKNQAFLVESVSGIEVVKAMSVEPQMERKWDEQLAAFVTSTFTTQNLSNITQQVSQWISKITTLVILWLGSHLVIKGELTVGQLIAFNMFASQVNGPILRLVQLWQEFQQASLSVKRLGDILNSPSEPAIGLNKATLPNLKGHIRFKEINFQYQPELPPCLEGINLTFEAGKQYGLVGRSGSGKSTLTKLLQRLYLPSNGQVLIDDIDISQVSPSWLRSQIGVVQQETILFNTSIRENIALAMPAAPLELVVKVAQLSGADEFVREFPQGYDTVVGEHGSRLSGGQKQRIGIARALLTNPKIIIFDEATSALDYESEQIIRKNMSAISRGRTVLIVAHRLSTVRHCDELIVLAKGKVIERGNHFSLLNHGGAYARLYSMQLGEGEVAV